MFPGNEVLKEKVLLPFQSYGKSTMYAVSWWCGACHKLGAAHLYLWPTLTSMSMFFATPICKVQQDIVEGGGPRKLMGCGYEAADLHFFLVHA